MPGDAGTHFDHIHDPVPFAVKLANLLGRGFQLHRNGVVLACGLSVMLLRRADWLYAAGSVSLGVFTAASWGIAFTLLTALATAALSRLIGLNDQSAKRTWLHEQGLILLAAASAVLGIATTAHLVGAFGLSGQLVALNIGLTATVMSLSRMLWRRRTSSDSRHGTIAKNFTMKILPAR